MRSVAGLATVVLAAAACGLPLQSGSGTIVESQPRLEAVSMLTVTSAFEVRLAVGDEPSLVLRTDDNLVDRVRVDNQGDELSLELDGAVRNATLEADLTVPADALESIRLSGASSVTGLEPLDPEQLSLQLNGASRVFLVVAVDELTVDADGASVANVGGQAQALSVRANGASSLRLDELAAQTATVDADGASTVEVLVEEDLQASAAGASTIRYGGDPQTLDRDVSGASTVTQR